MLAIGRTYKPTANSFPIATQAMGISYIRTKGTGTGVSIPGTTFFRLDEDVKQIAGIDFDDEKLFTGDGETSGVTIDANLGIIGHGDENSKTLRTHAGQFLFAEDVISSPGGSAGQTYEDVGGQITLGNYQGSQTPAGDDIGVTP